MAKNQGFDVLMELLFANFFIMLKEELCRTVKTSIYYQLAAELAAIFIKEGPFSEYENFDRIIPVIKLLLIDKEKTLDLIISPIYCLKEGQNESALARKYRNELIQKIKSMKNTCNEKIAHYVAMSTWEEFEYEDLTSDELLEEIKNLLLASYPSIQVKMNLLDRLKVFIEKMEYSEEYVEETIFLMDALLSMDDDKVIFKVLNIY